MSLVSIVAPVYHNAPSLPELVAKFQELAQKNESDTFEFVFVDDGSRDESFNVLQRLAQSEPRIRIIKLSRNFGSNAAILAGLSHAIGDIIAVISADLQDPPELLHEMLDQWRHGKKVVLAARESRSEDWLTQLFANVFYWLFRRYAIQSMPKRGFDFFLVDRQVCDLITNIQENNAYLMGLVLWLGFDPSVIYYHRRKREERFGRSMWTFRKKLKYFTDSFVAFSHTPVHIASLLGIGLAMLGFAYAVLTIVLRVFYGEVVEGWTSLMVVILITSGAQLLMVGINGEYLVRNLDETRRRPRFIVEQVVQVSGSTEQTPSDQDITLSDQRK